MAGGSAPSILQVQKRPDDVIVKALTCDGAEDSSADDGKDKAAQSLGAARWRGRAKSLTKAQRTPRGS
jgi:hypothetical protein